MSHGPVSDPRVLPLGMVQARAMESSKTTKLTDRTIYEFPVIGAVALADDRPWSPIILSRAGKSVRLLKPVWGQTGVEVKGLLTDQHIDFRHSLFKLETDLYPEQDTLQPLIYIQS